MKNTIGLFVFLAASAAAQTVETIPYRAVLSPRNEAPPIEGLNATGTATVWLHLMRDAGGQVVSGSVDFSVRYEFPGAATFTGMHIHRGAAGANGGVVIDPSLARFDDAAGRGQIRLQAQIPATDARGLSALNDILADPSGFYVNLHTSANPAGAIRGQLMPAKQTVLMTLMNPMNEVPAITGLPATGVGAVMLVTTQMPDGTLTSAEVAFDVNYTGFPEGTNFTGFHIHSGAAGANGPVVINTGLSGQVAAEPSGAGNLRYEVEVSMANANAVNGVYALLGDPRNHYLNLHTSANPGGAIRGQMRTTDRITLQSNMLPENEAPPVTGLEARAGAALTLHTLRSDAGAVQAGWAIFDVNYRFPGETQFTGLHVHNGAAGSNGVVSIDSGLSRTNTPLSPTGFGNHYRMAAQSRQVSIDALNSIVRNPERHYLNLHTSTFPAGAVRGQTGASGLAAPRILDVLSGVSDGARRTLAPLGLFTVFGSNLLKAVADSGGIDAYAPFETNGVIVTVGGRWAALVTLARDTRFTPSDHIVAQLPADVPAGQHAVQVTTPDGVSNTMMVTVAEIAPALYFDAEAGIAFRPDNTLARRNSPSQAGETIRLMATGLGATSPVLESGQRVPTGMAFSTRAAVTATIGGRTATVLSSTAIPGFVGLNIVEVRVPDGVTGMAPAVISAGGMTSNTVMIPFR